MWQALFVASLWLLQGQQRTLREKQPGHRTYETMANKGHLTKL